MYMTRVVLKCLEPPQRVHAVLCAAFPDRSGPNPAGLWRVDNLEGSLELLMVSASTPELAHIVDALGADDDRNKTLPYAAFLARIAHGQVWNFRLCANPGEHRKKPSGKRDKMQALHTPDEQLAWLHRQSAQHGFRLEEGVVLGDEWRACHADTNTNDKKNPAPLRALTFEGRLSIANAEAFRTALTQGVGRSKAYGCGLLTIAKA